MRQLLSSRAGRRAIFLAAISSIGIVVSLDTFGNWAFVATLVSAAVAATAAALRGMPRRDALMLAAFAGVGSVVLIPAALAIVLFSVMAAYGTLSFACIVLDLAGAPADWCPLE